MADRFETINQNGKSISTWAEFKKYLDGTIAELSFMYTDSGTHYHILTDNKLGFRLEHFIIKDPISPPALSDEEDFVDNFIPLATTRLGFDYAVLTDSARNEITAVLDGADRRLKVASKLDTGDNIVGRVKLVDGDNIPATITTDAGVNRLEILGKVTLIGALPPPDTTPVTIAGDTPLVVGTANSTYVIPDGQTFHLQQIICGNEDPTKGAMVEVIFDNNGTERLVTRAFTAGATIELGYADISLSRDGTTMTGNVGGTNTIILRRSKLAGTNIRIDAVVRGFTS